MQSLGIRSSLCLFSDRKIARERHTTRTDRAGTSWEVLLLITPLVLLREWSFSDRVFLSGIYWRVSILGYVKQTPDDPEKALTRPQHAQWQNLNERRELTKFDRLMDTRKNHRLDKASCMKGQHRSHSRFIHNAMAVTTGFYAWGCRPLLIIDIFTLRHLGGSLTFITARTLGVALWRWSRTNCERKTWIKEEFQNSHALD